MQTSNITSYGKKIEVLSSFYGDFWRCSAKSAENS